MVSPDREVGFSDSHLFRVLELSCIPARSAGFMVHDQGHRYSHQRYSHQRAFTRCGDKAALEHRVLLSKEWLSMCNDEKTRSPQKSGVGPRLHNAGPNPIPLANHPKQYAVLAANQGEKNHIQLTPLPLKMWCEPKCLLQKTQLLPYVGFAP